MTQVLRSQSVLAVLVGLLGTCPQAWAVVETIDATVTAEVQEVENGTAVNSDFAFKDFNDTTSTLPLVALTNLIRFDATGEAGAAQAVTTFNDPRLSVLPDPNEFGVNLAAYSLASGPTYRGRSEATEHRDINFLAEEIGAPDGTALEAQSQFFVDGLIVVWGELDTTDLSGVSARVEFTVEQTLPDAPAENVLLATLDVTGQSTGNVLITAEGELSIENVAVVDLTNAVPELGPVHLIVIPNTAIPYTYPAQVGQPFRLSATVRASIENRPGTGASVLLGVPLLELGALLAELIGPEAADEISDLLGNALASAGPPLKPLNPSDPPTTVRILSTESGAVCLFPGFCCGAMGVEAGLLAVAPLAFWAGSRRRPGGRLRGYGSQRP